MTSLGESDPHIVLLACGVRATVVDKAKWKLLKRLLPPNKATNSKQILGHCRGTAQMHATLKDTKDAGVAVLFYFLFVHLPRLSGDGRGSAG